MHRRQKCKRGTLEQGTPKGTQTRQTEASARLCAPGNHDYSAAGVALGISRATIFSRIRADLPERPRM